MLDFISKVKAELNVSIIIALVAVGGFAYAAFSSTTPPLFQNTDNFVLFADENIELQKDVQISSGDIGSNNKLDIDKDAIIIGNLFANRIDIDKNTTVNGNASFNQLKLHKEARILGTQTKPVQLPIANLPPVPDFQVGTQDLKFQGQNNTLAAGSYQDIALEKDSRLTLTGGIYNLRKLELKDGAVLIFDASTILNIQFKLRGHNRVSILPGLNLKPDDLVIN
ncbi:MAG: polymer-forming cytoskeletal protein, partial [Parcubacteria group bacterium]|nr:polymer-forming cytoskeletal protein [Parcubacteria group bacterium]